MKLSRRPALNGIFLDEIDNRILIQGVETAAGKDSVSAVSVYGNAGQRMTGEHRDTLEVTVSFSMLIRRTDLAARADLFERACAWAASGKGGWLTLNFRPDRRLRVDYVAMPAMGDITRWTNRYTFTFRAYAVPYWQQETPTMLRMRSVSSADRQFGVSGNAQTVMDVEFQNTSGGTVDAFSFTAGESTFAFANLGLADGEALVIDHAADGILRIRIRGDAWRSALDKRTPESSDDLYVEPGQTRILMTAGGAGTLTVRCFGRFVG